MQPDPQQKSYRRDKTSNTAPTNIWAILLVVCRLLPFNHLIPIEKRNEGISIRASCFDGGIGNVRVGWDRFSSKSVSLTSACNACVGLDFVEINGWWWLVDCFGNGLEDIFLDVVAMEVWVWELLFRLGYLWLYGSSREWLRLLWLLLDLHVRWYWLYPCL